MGLTACNSFHSMSKHIRDFFALSLNVHRNFSREKKNFFPCFRDLMLDLDNAIFLPAFKICSKVKCGFLYKFPGILNALGIIGYIEP